MAEDPNRPTLGPASSLENYKLLSDAEHWRRLPRRIRGGDSALEELGPRPSLTRRKKSDRPFAVGDFYSFRTASPYGYPAPDRARYGAFRIIGIEPAAYVATLALDGVFDHPPALAEVAGLPPAPRNRDHQPDVLLVSFHTVDGRLDLTWLGTEPLAAAERSLYAGRLGTHYGPWVFIASGAETRWRLKNDPIGLKADEERADAARLAADVADAERYRAWRNRLSWDVLLAEKHFARWSRSPPFPPTAFTTAARDTINRTIRTIADLGPKPAKAAVRAALKECVEWFNVEAARAGDVVETEEREDILMVLANICFVARQRSLNAEIDEWRAW